MTVVSMAFQLVLTKNSYLTFLEMNGALKVNFTYTVLILELLNRYDCIGYVVSDSGALGELKLHARMHKHVIMFFCCIC